MTDPTASARWARLLAINARPHGRQTLEAEFGDVWDPGELAEQFEVIGFLAPYVVVRRRADRAKGSLEFQHDPRFYFQFWPHRAPLTARTDDADAPF